MIIERPWGYFVNMEEKESHKVKRIVVYGNQRLSYQMHNQRSETWIFLDGQGIVTIDDVDHQVGAGSIIKIPAKAKHRVKNTGVNNLQFIEVQAGTYFGEDDIVRYSDDYGRAL